jgi:hypothetical protein
MSIAITGQTIYSGSVFYYDTYNVKSYVGEPTTNLVQSASNYTATNYASSGEWTSDPTRFIKSYNANIATPLGFGATLCSETSSYGFYHLSTLGGGGEDGLHSISCYVNPLSVIKNFTIGMLGDSSNMVTFNIATMSISYGGTISNRNAFIHEVVGYPGWYRLAANIEGRFGGWVGCIGLDTYTQYTPSLPYKSFYITGLQYEYKARSTAYVFGTRTATQGLLDLTGANSIDLTNAGYVTGSISLNGTSEYFTIGTHNLGNQFTICVWARPTSISGDTVMVGTNANGCDNWFSINNGYAYVYATETADVNNYPTSGNTLMTVNTWNYICMTMNTNTIKVYLNGVQDGSSTAAFNIATWNGAFSIGSRCPDLAQRYFPGEIGNVVFYNHVLSDAQILKNFNRTKSRYGL